MTGPRFLFPAAIVALLSVGPLSAQAQQVDDETFLQLMTNNKLPRPQTLSDFAEQVRRMQQMGADNAQIAEYMSKVIERQLEATNKPQGESLFNPLKPGTLKDRAERWQPINQLIDGDGRPGKQMDDGRKAETIARLAWEYQVGNCAESASVAYTVLKSAGIPARIFNSAAGGGHEFVVVGLAAGADSNDPSTWGPNARVVDGWIGRSLTPEEARGHRHLFGGRTVGSTGREIVSDVTLSYDRPELYAKYLAMGTKGGSK